MFENGIGDVRVVLLRTVLEGCVLDKSVMQFYKLLNNSDESELSKTSTKKLVSNDSVENTGLKYYYYP